MSVSSIFNGYLPLSNLTLNNFSGGTPTSSSLTCGTDTNNDVVLNVSSGVAVQGNLVVSGTIESTGGTQPSEIALINAENTFSVNQIFQDSVSIGTVSGGLTVSTATASDGAVIYGAVTINGNLLVDGNLDVTGTGGGGGGTGGDYAYQDQANVFTALNTFEDGITITASGANITGATEITGATTVNGAMTIDGNTAITGTLTVNGVDISSGGGGGGSSDLLTSANTWSGTNTFDDTVSVASTLGVSGDCTFGNGATNTITVNGNLVVTGTITDDQGGTVVDPNTAYVDVANTFTPDQTFNGNVITEGLIVNNSFEMKGSGVFDNAISLNNTCTFNGDCNFDGINTFNNVVYFKNGVDFASGNLNMNNIGGLGSITLDAGVSLQFSLQIGSGGSIFCVCSNGEYVQWNYVSYNTQRTYLVFGSESNNGRYNPNLTFSGNVYYFTAPTVSESLGQTTTISINGSPILAPNPQ